MFFSTHGIYHSSMNTATLIALSYRHNIDTMLADAFHTIVSGSSVAIRGIIKPKVIYVN